MTRAAVWGASGFIGGALCAAAEAKGWTVQRLGRVELDLEATPAQMSAALQDIDVAYHCAGKAGDGAFAGYAASAGRFAQACAAANVGRLVYLSTVAVYGPRWSGDFGPDTPLVGTDAYAASRIEAEVGIVAALSGSTTRWHIVRVPMMVGPGMPGTVLARFFRVLRLGVFPHPGPESATLACLGVRRLAAILLRLPEEGSGTLQFADHLRWTELARCHAEARGKPLLRLRVPNPGGPFRVFASTARYADDTGKLRGGAAGVPSTWGEIDALVRP